MNLFHSLKVDEREVYIYIYGLLCLACRSHSLFESHIFSRFHCDPFYYFIAADFLLRSWVETLPVKDANQDVQMFLFVCFSAPLAPQKAGVLDFSLGSLHAFG